MWRSSASASSKVRTKLVPSIGSCSKPSTWVGSGKPMAANTVGAMSMQWVNWLRTRPSGRIRAGQATTNGSRVPPRWLAICLPHCNGVLLACAHALAKCGAVNSSPSAAMPPYCSISSNCRSASRSRPLRNVISLNEPVLVPSMLAPLSPQM
ncbi:Uncharacterised protein [Mycobacterium tuberculosis]|nr:Uncharacterised protein [Mycobacterium tuberculosis]